MATSRADLVGRLQAKPWKASTRRIQNGLTHRTFRMTVLAQDPSIGGREPLIATVDVPAEPLDAGPRGHRFHVVDWDPTQRDGFPPAAFGHDWNYQDRFASRNPRVFINDAGFHAQNVFAIAARTLDLWQSTLGRRIAWQFPEPQLYLVPHAFAEANAYYSRDDHAVLFGYLPIDDRFAVYTCLSHDIVAHEVTHAILDGIRPRLLEPGLPDQPAFHEALADIVALLSVLSLEPVVARLLVGSDRPISRISSDRVLRQSLEDSPLLAVAEELGEAVEPERGEALRRSVRLRPGNGWRRNDEYAEPHRRGEVFVAGVMFTLLDMWIKRLEPLIGGGTIDAARAAEEGAKVAQHLMTMCVRGVDYCPPVELEFEDVLDAILTADEIVAPDDKHGYRQSLRAGFARYDIRPSTPQALAQTASYEHINADALRASRVEAYRLLWQNHELLGLDLALHTTIERVCPTSRRGPDGLRVDEILIDYTQTMELTAGELKRQGIDSGELAPATPVQLWGGGVIVCDQFARMIVQVDKPIADADRQQRRLDYLIREDLIDSTGRVGFSLGVARGQEFAQLHAPRDREAW